MTDICTKEMLQYIVGEVTRVRADEIDAHLEACQYCRELLYRLRRMIEMLDETDPDIENIDLTSRVRT